MIVDAWIQHPGPGFLKQPMFASLLRWMGLDEPPDDVPLALTLGAMRAAHLDKALISAWHGPHGPLLSNDQVAAWVAEAPDLFVGIASVDLSRPKRAVDELKRCVEELGFRGLRMLPWLWQLPPDHRLYYPLYVACIDLGVPFCTQIGHAGPLMPSEPGRPIPYLDQVACDFPELTIVAGHLGYPWVDDAIGMARKYENVYLDTSAWAPKRFPEAFRRFLAGGGHDKVLFGSNYPMIQPHTCLAQVDALGLSDDARAAFLGENARRVFGL